MCFVNISEQCFHLLFYLFVQLSHLQMSLNSQFFCFVMITHKRVILKRQGDQQDLPGLYLNKILIKIIKADFDKNRNFGFLRQLPYFDIEFLKNNFKIWAKCAQIHNCIKNRMGLGCRSFIQSVHFDRHIFFENPLFLTQWIWKKIYPQTIDIDLFLPVT